MGLLNSWWFVKKLETAGVSMPEFVTLKIWWYEGFSSPTFYKMYKSDIEEMIVNYQWGDQALLFTFVEMDTWKWWVWDQLCREPKKIEIDEIKF